MPYVPEPDQTLTTPPSGNGDTTTTGTAPEGSAAPSLQQMLEDAVRARRGQPRRSRHAAADAGRNDAGSIDAAPATGHSTAPAAYSADDDAASIDDVASDDGQAPVNNRNEPQDAGAAEPETTDPAETPAEPAPQPDEAEPEPAEAPAEPAAAGAAADGPVETEVGSPSTPQPAAPTSGRTDRRRSKLNSHVWAVFAGRTAGLRKFDAALSWHETADPTGRISAYRSELADLIAELPPQPTARIHQTVREANLVGQLRDLDDTPAGIGAIGQVHRGTWLDGTDVAVKFMHPDVWTTLPADLGAIAKHARRIGKHLPGLDVPTIVADLHARAADNVTFREEAARQHAFAAAFGRHATASRVPGVHVPLVRLESPTVLVTDWTDGTPLRTQLPDLTGEERRTLGQDLVNVAVASLTDVGMLHADLHLDNLLLGADRRLVLTDFAVCAPAPVRLADVAAALFRAGRAGDAPVALRGVRDLGLTGRRASRNPDDALKATRAFLKPLDEGSLDITPAGLAALLAAARKTGNGLTPPVALAAALRALFDSLTVAGALTPQIDTSAALGLLPGLHAST